MTQVPYSWCEAHILTRSYEKEVPILVITLQFLTNFVNFDNICHVILKKSFFFRE